MRTPWGFQKIASTFHGYAQNPLFKGILGVLCARGTLEASLHARKAFIYWDSRMSVKGGTFFLKTIFLL